MDGLFKALLKNHSLPLAELEAVVFNNEAYRSDDEIPQPTTPFSEDSELALFNDSSSSQLLNLSNLKLDDESKDVPVHAHPLAGSTSLQVLQFIIVNAIKSILFVLFYYLHAIERYQA